MSDSDERSHAPDAGPTALAPAPGAARLAPRHYHVALTPKEVLERLSEQPGVKAYETAMMPDFGGLIEDAEYTLELGNPEFTMHCGPPAARGQSATGMLRLLYLRGRMIATDTGTRVELRFAYRRPRWALQRWVGFLALGGLGLLWVLIGPGIIAKKAMLYGALLLVLGPVVVHDLRRADRIEEQRLALLNLIEHTFGAIQLDDATPDAPYRRRALDRARGDSDDDDADDDDEDSDEDDDEDDDDDYDDDDGDGSAKTPANT
ncbi:hypothetical protein [Enhygromyxa salina]|uniref:Uncharacterized protein n=1 Tax=Enhygromyxa salina TaxID=215803 RepID=A0A2S9YQ61_9BACT|nr:hypothetical protein [Enhygromyxa salina]PRQ07226.1 hypothetical protein ENSA7_29330 [Enhygromyxa salina]